MKHYLAAFFAKDAPSHIEVAFKPIEPFKPLVGVNVDRVEQRLTEAWDSALSRKIQLEIEIGRLKGELANTERAILAYDAALASIKPAPLEPMGSDAEWEASLAAVSGAIEEAARLDEEEAENGMAEVYAQLKAAESVDDLLSPNYSVDIHPITGVPSEKVVHP